MTTVYAGEVEVENGDFHMEFERFIIRENEIAIQGDGEDEEGEFNFEGTGQKNELGHYNITIKLVYSGWVVKKVYQPDKAWEGQGIIVINSIEETPKKQICSVVGAWIQDDCSWRFQGKLDVKKC